MVCELEGAQEQLPTLQELFAKSPTVEQQLAVPTVPPELAHDSLALGVEAFPQPVAMNNTIKACQGFLESFISTSV